MSISCFMFFANDLLLAFYFIFILDYWNDVRHKKTWVIFLFEFKMGHKARDNSPYQHIFGPGTANEQTVQWWFKKFCKEEKSLEDEERSGQPSEANHDQVRASSKLILFQLHEKLPKNSMVPILINKDVFEPSYNDLKFRVQNHCYFCTNLIFPGSIFVQ